MTGQRPSHSLRPRLNSIVSCGWFAFSCDKACGDQDGVFMNVTVKNLLNQGSRSTEMLILTIVACQKICAGG
jgi:hypothetical protein